MATITIPKKSPKKVVENLDDEIVQQRLMQMKKGVKKSERDLDVYLKERGV